MKWPTMDEFAKNVADKALDEVEYKGKTLREWVEIIATSELGTNLAEVGTDAVSRKAVINAIDECYCGGEDSCGEPWIYQENAVEAIQMIEPILPAEPDIIYCKDCLKHNKRIGDYVEKSDGTYDWIWKDQACPLAEFRGVAQGHEFDYQFCAYGERRTE